MYLKGGLFRSLGDSPQFGIAAFGDHAYNNLFVAETNEYYETIRFSPLGEPNGLSMRPLKDGGRFRVGDACPIASFTRELGFVCDTVDYYFHMQRTYQKDISCPLFRLQLARITSEKDLLQESIAAISRDFFEDSRRGELWSEVELLSHEADRSFWLKQQSPTSSVVQILNASGEVYPIEWLKRRRNYETDEWKLMWRYVRAEHPFSTELAIVTVDWLSEGIDNDTLEVSNRMFRLELFRHALEAPVSSVEVTAIQDSLIEEIRNDSNVLLYLVSSESSFQRIIALIGDELNVAERERIVSLATLRGFHRVSEAAPKSTLSTG